MTLQQAMKANIRIVPGHKHASFGGWCRHDRVLLDGSEIGKIQTRRAEDRKEFLTINGNLCTDGYDVDWLVRQISDQRL